jgi:hypothetical protein
MFSYSSTCDVFDHQGIHCTRHVSLQTNIGSQSNK